jgi:hypothetical protein
MNGCHVMGTGVSMQIADLEQLTVSNDVTVLAVSALYPRRSVTRGSGRDLKNRGTGYSTEPWEHNHVHIPSRNHDLCFITSGSGQNT